MLHSQTVLIVLTVAAMHRILGDEELDGLVTEVEADKAAAEAAKRSGAAAAGGGAAGGQATT